MTSTSRPRRAFWGDLRFLIGIGLVAVSITGVWLVIASAERTTPVLQATRTIVQGEPLVSDDFRVVDVGLGVLEDDYLAPQDLEADQIAARTIAADELVPASAMVDARDGSTTTVVVESSTGIPDDVSAGTRVELWQAPLLDDGRTLDVPRILVADAVIAAVVAPEGVLASAGATVEVVIDRADVADVLSAMTSGAAISVVPTGVAP